MYARRQTIIAVRPKRYKTIVPVRHMLGVYSPQLSLVCKRELLMRRQQDLVAVDQMPIYNNKNI